MTTGNVRRVAHAAAILVFAIAAAAAAVNRELPASESNLLLELEFASTPQAVRARVEPSMRDAVDRAQRADSRFLIPAYWAAFVAAGIVLVVSRGSANRRFALAVMLLITVAAAADYGENDAIGIALSAAPAEGAAPLIWARVKWVAFFLATAALVPPLVAASRARGTHATLTALCLAAAAVVGLAATAVFTSAMPYAVMLLALGLFGLALLFLWNPEYFATTS
ncbi:MAG TPA: hypothetical protein VMO26_09625 [Vicinamibacterales bacterium]|nr:hypothetical protein [Vicinamibacterales bacterium]